MMDLLLQTFDETASNNFCFELLIDAIGNLGEFFENLATNLQTMENRNLLPNQIRLLGENEKPHHDVYGFANSVSSDEKRR